MKDEMKKSSGDVKKLAMGIGKTGNILKGTYLRHIYNNRWKGAEMYREKTIKFVFEMHSK